MMRIYAVRDRLIDYYMQPFVGPNEKEVMAALARTVNNEVDTNGISQAPHHFELWELGTIDEEGNITPTRKLICDCASLIRGGVRTAAERRGAQAQADPSSQPAPTGGAPGRTRTNGRALPPEAHTEAEPTAEVPRQHRGGYPPADA